MSNQHKIYVDGELAGEADRISCDVEHNIRQPYENGGAIIGDTQCAFRICGDIDVGMDTDTISVHIPKEDHVEVLTFDYLTEISIGQNEIRGTAQDLEMSTVYKKVETDITVDKIDEIEYVF